MGWVGEPEPCKRCFGEVGVAWGEAEGLDRGWYGRGGFDGALTWTAMGFLFMYLGEDSSL